MFPKNINCNISIFDTPEPDHKTSPKKLGMKSGAKRIPWKTSQPNTNNKSKVMKDFAELESSFIKAQPDSSYFPKRKNNFLEITKKKALVNFLSKTQIQGQDIAELGKRLVDNLQKVRRTIAKNAKKFLTKGSIRCFPSRPSTTKPIRENWNTINHTSALELGAMNAERLKTMNTTWSNFSAEKTQPQTRLATVYHPKIFLKRRATSPEANSSQNS
jgi:hypothetical protein